MDRETLTSKHDLWHANIANWEFYIRSYLGGNDYKMAITFTDMF